MKKYFLIFFVLGVFIFIKIIKKPVKDSSNQVPLPSTVKIDPSTLSQSKGSTAIKTEQSPEKEEIKTPSVIKSEELLDQPKLPPSVKSEKPSISFDKSKVSEAAKSEQSLVQPKLPSPVKPEQQPSSVALKIPPAIKLESPITTQPIENINKDIFKKSIEDYLNGITALTSDFLQTNPNGTQVRGKVWLKRSKKDQGKMRLDYDPTLGQRIIAKDDMLTIYDLKDKSESYYTLDSTPAAFILKNNLSLSKDVQVVNLQRTTNERILIKLTRPGDPEGMSLTFIFSLYPNGHIKSLIGWIVIDGQGNETIIKLMTDKMHVNDQKLVNDKVFSEPFIE